MPPGPDILALSPCRAPWDLLPALAGKMGREDGCEAVWAAWRLWPKILPVIFITNICGVLTRTHQNVRTHSTGNDHRVKCLFTYWLLFINWESICFYTFKMGLCVKRSYSLPCAVEGHLFPLEEAYWKWALHSHNTTSCRHCPSQTDLFLNLKSLF